MPPIVDARRRMVQERSARRKVPGPKLYCVSGHVVRPGVFELPMGTSLRELIYEHAGGMPNGKKLKAVIPGGSSVPVFTADEIDVAMDFESVAKAGSLLGSCGVIVMDEDTCMVQRAADHQRTSTITSRAASARRAAKGTGWLEDLLTRSRRRRRARRSDVELLLKIADNMMGNTVCVLADAAAMPVTELRHQVPLRVRRALRAGGCPQRPAPRRSRPRAAHA